MFRVACRPRRRAALISLAVSSALAVVALAMPASSAVAASPIAVTIKGYRFDPSPLTVHVGDTVAWTNEDTAPHDVTSTAGPIPLQSPMLHTGASWTYTFTTAGTYTYICSIHPDMHGVVTVLAVAAPPSTAATRGTTAPAPSSVEARLATPASSTSTTQPVVAAAPPEPVATTQASPAAAAPVQASSHIKPFLWISALVAGIVIAGLLLVTGVAPAAPGEPLDPERDRDE